MPLKETQPEKNNSDELQYQRDGIPPAMQNWLSQSKQAEPWSPVHVQVQPARTRSAEASKL
ncbi:hypothetical protein NOF04DRAFT_14219 [Fusarium oxysporum II5]|uniref:Uncharacterized protein n=2 Tax=Fusarium oxysporum species complex TaxID=171631 RepID=X0IW41_FUSO5|nr:uncharacterized protein FOIG_14006 [Fusarium odoratissimum NRRL 54006]EXL93137.1 hypothetical protein FOIG_14006 [Fusarium odoratissimum NRRL 54006]KAK2134432.1 hypothetical protein NOF04DRAFT_14219 [Fusarium oxysporum II5]TXC11442.1 hypothetical protein FocTR4_00007697 [Fusarium oxysporum f. sp. cubense]